MAAAYRLVELMADGTEHAVAASDSLDTLESVGRKRQARGLSVGFRTESNDLPRRDACAQNDSDS